MAPAATPLKGVSSPPLASPSPGARARSDRPASISRMETAKVRRTPQVSARPPKNSMQMVMPAVSRPTIQPVGWSASRPYSLK